MYKKLSDALSTLSVKTKSVEDKIEAARAEAKEILDSRIAESKLEAIAKKEQFISQVENLKANAEVKSNSVKDSINKKIELLQAELNVKKEVVKNKIEEKKFDFNVDVAENNYHDACTHAENNIQWAIVALAEVETATLEAYAAKLKLEDLKKTNS